MNINQYFCNLDQAYLMAINTLKIRTIGNYPKIFNSPGYLNDQFLIYIGNLSVLYIHTNYQISDQKYKHSEFEIYNGSLLDASLTVNVRIRNKNLFFTRKVML